MKKIVLLLSIVLFSGFASFAQSNKNDLNLSVSALPLLGKAGNYSGINGFVLKTAFLYNITNKTTIGINFAYAGMDQLKVARIDAHYNSYTMVPSIRNSFINHKKFRMFAEIGFGFGTIQYKPDNINNFRPVFEEISGGVSVLNVGVGINYLFNDTFGLEILVPYIYTKNITSKHTNTLYSGVGPTIGLVFKLN